MPVLVDTSIWIEGFRERGDSRLIFELVGLVAGEEACITGMVKLELIRGARPEVIDILRHKLSRIASLDTEEYHFDAAGELGYTLARQGFTIPQTDLLVAAIAIDHGVPLFYRDRHLDIVCDHSELKKFGG